MSSRSWWEAKDRRQQWISHTSGPLQDITFRRRRSLFNAAFPERLQLSAAVARRRRRSPCPAHRPTYYSTWQRRLEYIVFLFHVLHGFTNKKRQQLYQVFKETGTRNKRTPHSLLLILFVQLPNVYFTSWFNEYRSIVVCYFLSENLISKYLQRSASN